jgi:hypothetical protein
LVATHFKGTELHRLRHRTAQRRLIIVSRLVEEVLVHLHSLCL